MTDLGPGTALGGYRIVSLIGRGGMGVVYLAEHVALDRRVALKVVAPELQEDESFRERFLREARLAASLEHPNIIPVYDAGVEGGVLFLAMRFVDGENLGHLIEREERLPADRAVEILAKVASALDEAHRNGLVHRDVKPDNVLLGTSGSVYLTDFGLVRRLDSASRLTKTGYMMGTLNYMAPEVFRGQAVDGRTDVYSLACVLFECLTGAPPYPHELQPAVISSHLMDPVPRVTASQPRLPIAIDQVVARGMAKDPEDRFRSSGELIRSAGGALGAAGAGEVVPPDTLPSPPPGLDREATQPAPPPTDGDGSRNRTRWAWIGAGLIVLVSGIVAASLLVGDGGPGPTGATATGTNTTGSEPRDPAFELVATVDGIPSFVDLDFGATWVGSDDGTRGILTRVDPQSGAVEELDVGRRPVRMTFTGTDADGSVWTANQGENTVSRVDVPLSNEEPVTYPVGEAPSRIQSPRSVVFVWVANGGGGSLTRIDSTSASVDQAIVEVPVGSRPQTLSATPGTVVTADERDGTATIVDGPTATRVATVPVGTSPSSVVLVPPDFWVSNAGDGTISVVDPRAAEVIQEIEVGSQPTGLTGDGRGSVWVRNEGDATLSRVSVESFEEVSTVSLRSRPVALAMTPGAVWVAVSEGTLVRVDLDDESTREFEMGCRAISINSPWPDPSTFGPELQGVWVACEDGAILHIDADA
jgi:YVTN family beta-propeller protein